MFNFSEVIEKGSEIIEISNSTLTLLVFLALGVGSLVSDGVYYGSKFLIRLIKERKKKNELQHKH